MENITPTLPNRTQLQLVKYVWVILAAFFFMACGNRTETSGEELISGTDGKTWTTDQELRADGSKVYDSEMEQTFKFMPDGSFTKTTSAGVDQGTWTYDPSRRSISLNYGGDGDLLLQVLSLKDGKMRLQVPNGSIMKLQSE